MSFRILQGHVLTMLQGVADESVDCCITSPPYWALRNYNIPDQVWGGDIEHEHAWQGAVCECGAWLGSLGLEPTPELFVAHIVLVFREVRRVLRKDGTLWLNLGDSYSNDTKWGGTSGGKNYTSAAGGYQGQRVRRGKDCDPKRGTAAPGQPMGYGPTGCKPKDLVGIPWMVAFALRADGWYLRSDIIFSKPNPMPESVTDRPTKSHEYLFLLAKSPRYYYDADAIKEQASPDSHARYARGRSDTHKWADGGPGNQSITKSYDHMRLDREGPNSRMHVDRDPRHSSDRKDRTPAGWHQGTRPATPDGIWDKRQAGVNPKCAEPGSGIKQNSSFGHVVKDLVDFRNKRSVWTIPTQPTPEAHFATYPIALVEPCILAGCPPGGLVLDPFAGAGTTGLAATKHGRRFLGIELNPEYVKIIESRVARHCPLLVTPTQEEPQCAAV